MSKLRVSFSAIIMLIVLSVYSAVAFAAAPAAPTGVDASITSKNELRVSFTKVTGATSYKVFVNGVEKATPAHPSSSTVTVVNAFIPVGAELATNEKATFTAEVSAVNADGESAKLQLHL